MPKYKGTSLRVAGQCLADIRWLFGTAAVGVVSVVTITVTEIATLTIPGAALGDLVLVNPDVAQNANISWMAYVSAANTVKIRATNPTAGSINTVSANWRCIVIKL